MKDEEIRALLKTYEACSERGHPSPCICSSIEQKHWHHLAKEVLVLRAQLELKTQMAAELALDCANLRKQINTNLGG